MNANDAAAIASAAAVAIAIANMIGQVILSRQATKNHSEVMNGGLQQIHPPIDVPEP